MNVMKLDPTIRARAEAELGRGIPEPDSPEYEALIEDLRGSHPELAEEMMQSLAVQGVVLPAQVQAHKAARRDRRRELGMRLFYHRVYPGELVVNRKRVMYSLLGAMGAGMVMLFILGGGLTSPAVAHEAEPDALEGEALEAEVDAALVEAHVLETPAQETQQDDAVVPIAPGDVPAAPPAIPAALTPPSVEELVPTASLPATSATPPAPGPVDPAYANPPGGTAEEPSSLIAWRREVEPRAEQPLALLNTPSGGPQANGLNVYGNGPAPTTQGGMPPSSLQPQGATQASPQAAPSATVVFSRSGQNQAQSGLSVYKRPAQVQAPQQQALQQQAPQAQMPQPQAVQPPAPQPQAAQPPSQPLAELPQPALEQTATAEAEAELEAADFIAMLQPGMRVPAQLVTGIVLVEGSPSPVVAETRGDWCGMADCPTITWIGQAALVAGNRVEAAFNQLVIGDEVRSISSLALRPDNTPGLTAGIRDEAPNAVQDLLRGAAGGISDYLQALTDRRRITIGGGLLGGGGVVIDDTEVPGIETFLAGRSASLFSLPEAQSAVLRIAEVPVGTPVVVLYGVSGR